MSVDSGGEWESAGLERRSFGSELLFGPNLEKDHLDPNSPLDPLTFERECVDVLRKIQETGLSGYLSAFGISETLRQQVWEDFLVSRPGNAENRPGSGDEPTTIPSTNYLRLFQFGLALGAHITVDRADPRSEVLYKASTRVQLTNREITSQDFRFKEMSEDFRGPEWMASKRRAGNSDTDEREEEFEVWIESCAGDASGTEPQLVYPEFKIPPGLSLIGVLNLLTILSRERGISLGLKEEAMSSSAEPDAPNKRMLDQFCRGIWAGVTLRSRSEEKRRTSRAIQSESDSVSDDPPPVRRSIAVAGCDYRRSTPKQLLAARRWQANGFPKVEKGADEHLEAWASRRAGGFFALFSSQGTGEMTWEPVLSFLRPGDFVIVKLARFPLVYEEGGELGRDRYVNKAVERASEFLPGGARGFRPIEGSDGGPCEFPVVDNGSESKGFGIAGVALVTSTPRWFRGEWQATIGMFRPFEMPLTYSALVGRDQVDEELPASGSQEIGQLFNQLPFGDAPDGSDEIREGRSSDDRFGFPARSMLDNRQFRPKLTLLNGDQWRLFKERVIIAHRSEQRTGEIREDFERLELASENLRRGLNIRELAAISPEVHFVERPVHPFSDVPDNDVQSSMWRGKAVTLSATADPDSEQKRFKWKFAARDDSGLAGEYFAGHSSKTAKAIMNQVATAEQEVQPAAILTALVVGDVRLAKEVLSQMKELANDGGEGRKKNEIQGLIDLTDSATGEDDQPLVAIDPARTRICRGWTAVRKSGSDWYIFMVDPDSPMIDIRSLCHRIAERISARK